MVSQKQAVITSLSVTVRQQEQKIERLTAKIERLEGVLRSVWNTSSVALDEISYQVPRITMKAVRKALAEQKNTNDSGQEYRCGLRLVFGDGYKRIAGGTIEGVPALIVSNDGIGVIGPAGGEKGPHQIKYGNELLAMIFEKEASINALIEEAKRAKRLFHEDQCQGCGNPEGLCDCDTSNEANQKDSDNAC